MFTSYVKKLILVLFLSLLDGILTICWISTGIASEGNPIMRYFLLQSSFTFLFVKLGLTFTGLGILYRYRDKKLAAHAANFVGLIYIIIILYHFIGYADHQWS